VFGEAKAGDQKKQAAGDIYFSDLNRMYPKGTACRKGGGSMFPPRKQEKNEERRKKIKNEAPPAHRSVAELKIDESQIGGAKIDSR